MSAMFELYYALPRDAERESRLTEQVASLGGRLHYLEVSSHVCMTFEFDDREKAELAEEALRRQGEHTEGVGDYGP